MHPQHHTAYYALLEVAKQEGVPLTTVIQNIEDAIKEAHSRAITENNTAIISAWSHIPCKGKIPTAVELISYLSELTALQ